MITKYFTRIIGILISLMVLGYGIAIAQETDLHRDLRQVTAYLLHQRPSYEKAEAYAREFNKKRNELIAKGESVPELEEDKNFQELLDECNRDLKGIGVMLAIIAERKPEAFQQYITQEAAAIRDKKKGVQMATALIATGADEIIEDQKHKRRKTSQTFDYLLWSGTLSETPSLDEVMTQPAKTPDTASVPAASSATATAVAQSTATPVTPASTGGSSKYTKFVKPMDPARAKQVSDSFTKAVEERKYYGHKDTGGGMMGISYGGKEKLPGATSTTATATPAGGEQDAITKDLISGLTDSNGALDAEQLGKAMDAICAQQGFKNYALVRQIRICTEEAVAELRPLEPKQ
jgi:hypothetical protein